MHKHQLTQTTHAALVLLFAASSYALATPSTRHAAKTHKTAQKTNRVTPKSAGAIPVVSNSAANPVTPVTPITSATPPREIVLTGQKTDLMKFLMPERPTVFVFYKPSSSIERDFVDSLERETRSKIGFRVIQLETGKEPIAGQYQILETPTALVFDRRGRLEGRNSNAGQILALVSQGLQVMRIDWAKEGDPRLDSVRQMMGGQKNIPAILRTMSLRPDYLQGFMAMSMPAQFTDGFIDRRTKELIGTYASAINKCKYCLGSHASNLQMQGVDAENVDAIAMLKIDEAKLSAKEHAMLDYVKVLTLEPWKVRDTHTEALRKASWNDDQIFEISFITALFAFANRMADAHGLGYPSKGWLPPSARPPVDQAPLVQKLIP